MGKKKGRKTSPLGAKGSLFSHFQVDNSLDSDDLGSAAGTPVFLLEGDTTALQSEIPPATMLALNNTNSSESEQECQNIEQPAQARTDSQEFAINLASFVSEQEQLKFEQELKHDLDKAKYESHIAQDIPSALDAGSSSKELFENLLKYQHDVANNSIHHPGGYYSLEQRTPSQELLENLMEYQKRHQIATPAANDGGSSKPVGGALVHRDSNQSLVDNVIEFQGRQRGSLSPGEAAVLDIDRKDSGDSLIARVIAYQQSVAKSAGDPESPNSKPLDARAESESPSTKVIPGVHTRASTLASTTRSGATAPGVLLAADAAKKFEEQRFREALRQPNVSGRSPARSLTSSSYGDSETEGRPLNDSDSVRVFGILESDLTLEQVIGTNTSSKLDILTKRAMARLLKLLQRVQQFSLDIHETVEDIHSSNATKIEWSDLQKAVTNLVTVQDFSQLKNLANGLQGENERLRQQLRNFAEQQSTLEPRLMALERAIASSEAARLAAEDNAQAFQSQLNAKDRDLKSFKERLDALENLVSTKLGANGDSLAESHEAKFTAQLPALPAKTAQPNPSAGANVTGDAAIINVVDREQLDGVFSKLDALEGKVDELACDVSKVGSVADLKKRVESLAGHSEKSLKVTNVRIETIVERLDGLEARQEATQLEQSRLRERRTTSESRGYSVPTSLDRRALVETKILEEKQVILEEQLLEIRDEMQLGVSLQKDVKRNSRHLDTLQSRLAELMDNERDEINEFRSGLQLLGSKVEVFNCTLENFSSQFEKFQADFLETCKHTKVLSAKVDSELGSFKVKLSAQDTAQREAADHMMRLAKLVAEYEALVYRVRDDPSTIDTQKTPFGRNIKSELDSTETLHAAHKYLDQVLDQRLAKFDRVLSGKVDQRVLEELLRHIGTRKELRHWSSELVKEACAKLRAEFNLEITRVQKLANYHPSGTENRSTSERQMEAFFEYLEGECVVPTNISAKFRERLNEWIFDRVADHSRDIDDKLSEFKKDIVRLLDVSSDYRQSNGLVGGNGASHDVFIKVLETKLRRELKKLVEAEKVDTDRRLADRVRQVRDSLLVHQQKNFKDLLEKFHGIGQAERLDFEQRIDQKLLQHRNEDALEVAALASRQLRQDVDEKLTVMCSQFSEVQARLQQSLEVPTTRYGQWIWKSGVLKFDNAVPWNYETANSDPDNLIWDKDTTTIKIKDAGLYEISFAFFTASKPSIQIYVNNESILSAINSSSYVVHHGSGFVVTDGKVQPGQVAGLSLLDFLALPAKSTLSIHYHGNRKQSLGHAFLGLRRLS